MAHSNLEGPASILVHNNEIAPCKLCSFLKTQPTFVCGLKWILGLRHPPGFWNRQANFHSKGKKRFEPLYGFGL